MLQVSVTALSMISRQGQQQVKLSYTCDRSCHMRMTVLADGREIVSDLNVVFAGGRGETFVMLPVQSEALEAVARFADRTGANMLEVPFSWSLPRKRTFYVMISSHTDIGLHNPPYFQRYNSEAILDKAMTLCDETAGRADNDQYRYTVEGTWFWNNYGADRGQKAARRVADDYIKSGKIGLCAGIAGNHMQVFGLEEMCRSTYQRKRQAEAWGLSCKTFSMIDNNGLPMSLIQPFSEAGYENIIFSPNQWNPLPSTVWHRDTTKDGYIWNCDAGGGGARIDVRYESNLPMLFFWENGSGDRLLVWSACQYGHGGAAFGLHPNGTSPVAEIEDAMASQLPLLDAKYPMDSWLLVCYSDDQSPNLLLTDSIRNWNEKWAYPQIRTLGDPDSLFDDVREKYGDRIPVLRGDITGGWYQHPAAAPELLAEKFAVDRLLPTAEKFSVIASLLEARYTYPAEAFDRAWNSLLWNDEHSYGTSGYQGRRVYETWMQHRDWIQTAADTAQKELQRAVTCIASRIALEKESVIVFNPTLQSRRELIESGERWVLADVPAFGYASVAMDEMPVRVPRRTQSQTPPVIENAYYRVAFAENGSVASLFDKELSIELTDGDNRFRINEPVYTNDNHNTFFTPESAVFEIVFEPEKTTVTACTQIPVLGAEIRQKLSLLHYEKRIDIENKLLHVRDMMNTSRYYRYLYYAFPFAVKNARRLCQLNGCVAEYARSVTGHGTDVYMAAGEWCCSENESYGAALIQQDSCLMEFDHIHPDKTDFGNAGEGSQMFSYLANDWLQMHCPGGSHLHYTFRYSIVSYKGSYKQAGIPQIAERVLHPVFAVSAGPQQGNLAAMQQLMDTDAALRLLTLKPADDGRGLIGRFYGENEKICRISLLGKTYSARRCPVDEREGAVEAAGVFSTYRFGENAVCISLREPELSETEYTGLIAAPRAACGEEDGMLYLLWGKSRDPELSHYQLYRSEDGDFEANEETFLTDVFPEEYCVGRYVDTGLKHHTCYHYRVRAVNRKGVSGPVSEIFSAFTKE